jgi:hypothetical protein
MEPCEVFKTSQGFFYRQNFIAISHAIYKFTYTFVNTIMKPVTLFTLLAFVAAVLFSCHSSTQNVQQKKSVKTPPPSVKKIAAKKTSGRSDTLIIDSTAAVFTIVESAEIEKRKKKYGDDFYTGADDFVFASSEAHNYLEKQNIKIIDANGRQFLKFVKADKSAVVIRLDTVSQLFNLYLFNPAKAPVNADMTNVEAEYKKYFSKL